MPYALQFALAGLTGISAMTDLYSRTIPNAVVVAGFAAGLALNGWLVDGADCCTLWRVSAWLF